jgi:hypothetical protein
MTTAQNGKGSRARKVNGDKYRACKLWDKKEPIPVNELGFVEMMLVVRKSCEYCGRPKRPHCGSLHGYCDVCSDQRRKSAKARFLLERGSSQIVGRHLISPRPA